VAAAALSSFYSIKCLGVVGGLWFGVSRCCFVLAGVAFLYISETNKPVHSTAAAAAAAAAAALWWFVV
jgi:hypothetical protein